MGLMGVTAGVRWFTDLAVPGWATFTVGLLLVLVVQLLSFATLFAFLIASRRSSLNFLLTRDAPYFILGKTTAFGTADHEIPRRARTVRQMTRAVADPEFKYAGSELELFEKARNWKAYWRAQIAGFVRGEVLEVGAGIGANTLTLADLEYDRWTCLEPDAALAARIELPPGGRHRCGGRNHRRFAAGNEVRRDPLHRCAGAHRGRSR